MWIVVFSVVIIVNFSLGNDEQLDFSSEVNAVIKSVKEEIKDKIDVLERMEYNDERSKAYMCAMGTSLEGLKTFTSSQLELVENENPNEDTITQKIKLGFSNLKLNLNKIVLKNIKQLNYYYVNKEQGVYEFFVNLKMSKTKPKNNGNGSPLLGCEIMLDFPLPWIYPKLQMSSKGVKKGHTEALDQMIITNQNAITAPFLKIVSESVEATVKADGRCTFKGETKPRKIPAETSISNDFEEVCGKAPQTDRDIMPGIISMESYHKNQKKVAQCYFCGEEMPASQLEMHVKHCGCVLEPCPDDCGLYVQRQYKNHHASWCRKDDSNKQPHWQLVKSELGLLKDRLDQEINQRKLQTEDYMQQLESYQLKMAKTEDLNLKLIDAVTGIRKLVSEEQCARLKDILEVKTNVSEVSKLVTQLKFTLNQTRVDVEELRNEVLTNEQYEKMYDQFQEWKKKQDEIVSSIKASLRKDVQAEINKLHKDNIIRSKSVNDLLDLNEVIIDNQDTYTEQIYHLELEVSQFKKFLAEENVMISGLWKEQLEEIKEIKAKFEENDEAIKSLIEEQKVIKDKMQQFEYFTKEFNNLNSGPEKFKVLERTVSQDFIQELIEDRKVFRERLESLEMLNRPGERTFSTGTSLSEVDSTIVKQQNEIAQRLETLEKLTTEIQNNCSKRNSSSTNNEQNDLPLVINELSSEQAVIKRRLEMVEVVTNELEEVKSRLAQNKLPRSDSPVSINGRLMWTISNFNAKLEESKETKTQIESPCFYTSECGYKLQLRAYLNGIGQWEGRHMIVSLHVLPSQWDGRLTWPCRLKVVFCLRDQEPIHRKAKDIVKSFTSSPAQKGFDAPCLQMFIPHRTLYTRNYLKNNVVIVEVRTLLL